MGIDDFAHLVGGHVLGLPAEGIADPVDKLVVRQSHGKSDIHNFHQVAGVKPGIAGFEGPAQDFLLCRLLAGVALESRHRGDFSQQQAGLAPGDLDTATCCIPHDFISIHVIFDQGDGQGGSADGAVLVEEIEKPHVALAGAVELGHPAHAESRLEFVPDVRPQAVAHHGAQGILVIVRLRRGIQQVAAQLADIDKAGSAVLAHFAEEIAGGKAAADEHGCAGAERGAHPEKEAGAMV